mmetsp:Transcript_15886/g.24090  ORF Transcript_15886/g.24090 Transcript_15886/m.24090 type:complete len:95 (-) Transcript_15886:344-628(-)
MPTTCYSVLSYIFYYHIGGFPTYKDYTTYIPTALSAQALSQYQNSNSDNNKNTHHTKSHSVDRNDTQNTAKINSMVMIMIASSLGMVGNDDVQG